MYHRGRAFSAGLIAISLSLPGCAQAAQIVTNCGIGSAPNGLNLATALQTGGDIVIQCGNGAMEIQLTQAMSVPFATAIDGEGRVTLISRGAGSMFELSGAKQLALRHLAIRNPSWASRDTSVVRNLEFDAKLELTDVQVSNIHSPFAVGQIVVRDSTFTQNGVADAADAETAVIMATNLNMRSVIFRDNLFRPFSATGRDSSHAQIIDCTFERNQRPSVWVRGDIAIVRSKFRENSNRSAQDDLTVSPDNPSTNVAGALEIFGSRASISNSKFQGNHGKWGGALLSYGSELTLQSSVLDQNQATWGGAVVHITPAQGIFAESPWKDLILRHVKLRGNTAVNDGGAVLIAGKIRADTTFFSGNNARGSGGAIGSVTDASLAAASGPTVLQFAGSFFLDNSAATGSAISAPASPVRLGNGIVSRNKCRSSAAVIGARVELANTTIVSNQGGGVRLVPGNGAPPSAPALTISNSILALNSRGNCASGQANMAVQGGNIQFPDGTCGGSIRVADPRLNQDFRPEGSSPARRLGAVSVCNAHELVDGRDIYGTQRGTATCSVGAVEADQGNDAVARLPSWVKSNPEAILLYLFSLAVACFCFGIFLGLRARKQRRAA